jgi:uncharacterized membrane protein
MFIILILIFVFFLIFKIYFLTDKKSVRERDIARVNRFSNYYIYKRLCEYCDLQSK